MINKFFILPKLTLTQMYIFQTIFVYNKILARLKEIFE